jgi:hypothetical protein
LKKSDHTHQKKEREPHRLINQPNFRVYSFPTETIGLARVLQALEATDWSVSTVSSPAGSITPTSPPTEISGRDSEAHLGTTIALGSSSSEPLLGPDLNEDETNENENIDENTNDKNEESKVENLEMLMNKMLAIRGNLIPLFLCFSSSLANISITQSTPDSNTFISQNQLITNRPNLLFRQKRGNNPPNGITYKYSRSNHEHARG